MPYASIDDLVQRFGAAEMIRASTPDGAEAVAVVQAPLNTALQEASDMIGTFLRKRYRVPLDVAPSEITRACCMLARYDLALGGGRNPGEQVKANRDEVVSWLRQIAAGQVVLDLSEVAPGDESYATFSTRPQTFNDQPPSCDVGGGFFTSGGAW